MAGGNTVAAATRFGRCRDALERSASAVGGDSWSEDTCRRLGDICGSQVCVSVTHSVSQSIESPLAAQF